MDRGFPTCDTVFATTTSFIERGNADSIALLECGYTSFYFSYMVYYFMTDRVINLEFASNLGFSLLKTQNTG